MKTANQLFWDIKFLTPTINTAEHNLWYGQTIYKHFFSYQEDFVILLAEVMKSAK